MRERTPGNTEPLPTQTPFPDPLGPQEPEPQEQFPLPNFDENDTQPITLPKVGVIEEENEGEPENWVIEKWG